MRGSSLYSGLSAILILMPVYHLTAQQSNAPAIPNLAGKVMTVLGPVEPSTLGETLTHEHIFIDFKAPPAIASFPANFTVLKPAPAAGKKRQALTGFDQSLSAIMEFKALGGGTIVDVSSYGLGRDPLALKLASEASGLNVVMGAGFYMRSLHPPDMDALTVEQLSDIIVRDITVGAQGSRIRSGIIGEVGIGVMGPRGPLTGNEIKSVRASARASRLTGAPINIHNFVSPEEAMKALDIVESEGVDLHHVAMSHTGTGSLATMEPFFKRGVFVEWDYMGSAPTPERGAQATIDGIAAMIEAGYAGQILISHDICTQAQLKENGGGGYTFVHDVILNGLKQKGVSDAVIRKIMVENPARLLTFAAPQPLVKAAARK